MKLRVRVYAACICVLLTVFGSFSQASTTELLIDSKHLDQPFPLTVTLPASYDEKTDKHYFILFDLHPRSHDYLSGMHDWMSHNGEWPWQETIVVTPSIYHKGFAALFEKMAEDPTDTRLMDVIESDILATLDLKFRTNGFNIYSGFMSNGAIGLYSLLHRPGLFDAYFIASPTLANDFLKISSSAKKQLPGVNDKMRFLYMSIGDHGYESAHTASVASLADDLKNHAHEFLQWHYKFDKQHYYMTRPIVTVVNGIELLFDDIHKDLPAESDIFKAGFDSIVAHYKSLSEQKYGFDVSAEGSLANYAKSQLDESFEQGITVYQKITVKYPDSSYAYSDLAKAYASEEKWGQAIASQKTAVEKSMSMSAWHQNRQKKTLEDYQQLGIGVNEQ